MGLIPLILAVVIGATVITPMVGWMLSLNASISNIDGKLEAMSVATTEWNRLNSMSMEELESQASALSDYQVGDYQVLVDIGNKGHMADGSCKTSGLSADDKLNCYKDSKITIRKDNQTLYTSRLMPLSASQGKGLSDGESNYGRVWECSLASNFSVPFKSNVKFPYTSKAPAYGRGENVMFTIYPTVNGAKITSNTMTLNAGDKISYIVEYNNSYYANASYIKGHVNELVTDPTSVHGVGR